MKPYYLVVCRYNESDRVSSGWMYANTWDTALDAEASVMTHLMNGGARCRILLACEPDPTDRAGHVGHTGIRARIDGGASSSGEYLLLNEWVPKDVKPWSPTSCGSST